MNIDRAIRGSLVSPAATFNEVAFLGALALHSHKVEDSQLMIDKASAPTLQ